MNELLELISKGIPISTPLNIFYNDIKELSIDKGKFEKNINKEFDIYLNFLKEKTIKCDIDFLNPYVFFLILKHWKKKFIFHQVHLSVVCFLI